MPMYPQLDHTLWRIDCTRIITAAGLPVPGKCCIRPCRQPSPYAELPRDRPALFAEVCDVEDLVKRRPAQLGEDPVYQTRFVTPSDISRDLGSGLRRNAAPSS